MKKVISILLFISTLLFFGGCTTENPIIVPTLLPPISGLTEIPAKSKPVMDGVYTVLKGQGRFGEQVVLKWRGNRLSIFSKNCYVVLPTGQKDSTIFMQGYWRVPTSDETGLASLSIAKADGGQKLLKGEASTNTMIKGVYGNESATPKEEFVMQYLRPFSNAVLTKEFAIIAHRGGGRTSDRLPVSENCPRMFAFAENLGANGIEIDIRLTKDKVPVLYHDPDLNIRLTVKGPLNGNINSFTYDQLSSFVRLIRGEKIPKLEEALEFVVDSTKIEFVWLDMKADEVAENIYQCILIQDRILRRAQGLGRKLQVLMGVPTEEYYNGLLATPGYTSVPSLCELSADQARTLKSKVWAPRWTLGTQNELVTQMKNEGRNSVCWTLDVPAYIKQYIEEGKFDGLLSNYPSIVTYYHFIR